METNVRDVMERTRDQLGPDGPAVRGARRRMRRAGDALEDSVDRRVRAARRAARRGRDVADDAAFAVQRRVRRSPWLSLGVAVAVGVVAGTLLGLAMPRGRGAQLPVSEP